MVEKRFAVHANFNAWANQLSPVMFGRENVSMSLAFRAEKKSAGKRNDEPPGAGFWDRFACKD